MKNQVKFARQCGAGFTIAQAGAVRRLKKISQKSPAVRAELKRFARLVGAMDDRGILSWGLLDELAAYGI